MADEAQVEDALARTRLANERTYLAWWRSGLTALAVSFGAGKLVPELAGGAAWPFQLLGAAFGVLGVAFVVFGYLRGRAVEEALARGGFAPLSDRVSLALTAAGVLLGAATVLLVFVEG
jgi:putative membrane protein